MTIELHRNLSLLIQKSSRDWVLKSKIRCNIWLRACKALPLLSIALINLDFSVDLWKFSIVINILLHTSVCPRNSQVIRIHDILNEVYINLCLVRGICNCIILQEKDFLEKQILILWYFIIQINTSHNIKSKHKTKSHLFAI